MIASERVEVPMASGPEEEAQAAKPQREFPRQPPHIREWARREMLDEMRLLAGNEDYSDYWERKR